jgi:hypothetical protein
VELSQRLALRITSRLSWSGARQGGQRSLRSHVGTRNGSRLSHARFTRKNLRYGRAVDLKAIGYFLLKGPVRAHSKHCLKVIGGQFRSIVRLAGRGVGAALRRLVGVVFGWCANREMRWPDTDRPVAQVADVEPIGHRPEVNLPRGPMGANEGLATCAGEGPVPPVRCCFPQPTRAELGSVSGDRTAPINLRPESGNFPGRILRLHQVSPIPGVTPPDRSNGRGGFACILPRIGTRLRTAGCVLLGALTVGVWLALVFVFACRGHGAC